ncbi:hypothetical protein C8J57DRAFT_1216825 [Mycena rebaudengoi]|nr:hypothetical protein C8J57DRAFT_1216825 [Mycena rebaudengoi]
MTTDSDYREFAESSKFIRTKLNGIELPRMNRGYGKRFVTSGEPLELCSGYVVQQHQLSNVPQLSQRGCYRKLKGQPRLKNAMAHPHDIDKKSLFYELRGIGAPLTDIGRMGDIYWDVAEPYIIYFCGPTGWQPWNPLASTGRQPLVEHPCYHDRYLWICENPVGLAWMTGHGLKLKGIDPKLSYTLNDLLQGTMTEILNDSTMRHRLALDFEDNKSRHEKEVARRTQNGVAVAHATATVNGSLKRKRGAEENRSSESQMEEEAPAPLSDAVAIISAEWKHLIQLQATEQAALVEEQRLRSQAEGKVAEFSIQLAALHGRILDLKQQAKRDAKESDLWKEKALQKEKELNDLRRHLQEVVNVPAFGELLRGLGGVDAA